MSWRLTPEERRIIERTRREGEAQTQGPAGKKRGPVLRSVLIWIAGIVMFYLLAMLMVWAGSLI